jgi:hypothetical protein
MDPQGRYIISGLESVQELRQIVDDSGWTLVLSLSGVKSLMSAFLEGRLSAASLEEIAEYLEMNEAVLTLPERRPPAFSSDRVQSDCNYVPAFFYL